MAEEVKRMRYFDGLFLKQDEFNIEQNYHIRMRRLHNRHLHSYGIVKGLDVVTGDNNKEIKITPGIALTKVKVTGTIEGEGIADEDTGLEIVLTKNVPCTLLEDDIKKGAYIYIYYKREAKDIVEEKGGTIEGIHWLENAVIKYDTDLSNIKGDEGKDDEGKIILAKVQSDDGNIVNASIKYIEDTDPNKSKPLRIYAGASGKLILSVENDRESSDLPSIEGKKFDTITGTTIKGIQVNSPATNFEGSLTVKSTVNATNFVGDGSGLTGITAGSSKWSDASGGVSGIYYDQGNVGIGTTTPDYRLVVEDEGNGGIKIHRPGAGAGLRFNMVNDERNWQLYHAGNSFSIEDVTADQKRLTIDINGNVGIGAAPTATDRLHVDGTVNATNFVGDGSRLTGITAGSSKWSDSVAPNPLGIYYDQGNVGIGTPSPAAPLDIVGSTLMRTIPTDAAKFLVFDEFSGAMRIYTDASPGTPGDLIIGTYPNGHLNQLFLKQSNGNVGIGMIPVSERLEVNGTVKASMFSGDGSQLTGVFPRIYQVPLLLQTLFGRAAPVTSVTVGKSPRCIAFDGAYIWVTNQLDPTPTVSKIDIYNNTVIKTVNVGTSPYGIAFDGMYIWVANYGGTNLSKIDITSDTETKVTPSPSISNPREIVYDGRFLWVTSAAVANGPINIINKIDTAGSVIWSTSLTGDIFGVAFDGKYIWAANPNAGTVSKITTDDNPVVDSTITIGGSPRGIAFDGKYIWVATPGSPNKIIKIDINTNTVVAQIPITANLPTYIAFDGKYIWVTQSDTVSKIDINSNTLVATVSVGLNTRGIAFDGRHMWVANSDSNNTTNRVTKI